MVLVVGVEHMSSASSVDVATNLLKASYLPEDGGNPAGFAGVFGDIAAQYFSRFGDQSDALAHIAVKNHLNALRNPLAQMHKELSFEFCRQPSDKNPYVAKPLKRTDCALVSDGAAAIILCNEDIALNRPQAVRFRAFSHVQDILPRAKRDVLAFEGPTRAWQQAYEQAGITVHDLSCVEVHDCFTIAELMSYEALGLTPQGQGARAILDGLVHRGGKLPINLSGGLKAKGHPIGATGVSMHVMNAMQVSSKAPEALQLKGATLAGAFNMGGVAVANYVSIVEAVR
jgi:acetyl-CoA C-acetyltransferase